MKKIAALILGTLIVSILVLAVVGAQSGTKRRTPVLTTDDLGSARETASPSVESEVQPSVSRNAEVARGSIAWHRDIRQAIETARGEDKIVVVDVYTDWCGWCKKMDKTIYADPAIVALSRREVFVKVNAEDGGQGQQFARQMRVRGYPTTIFLDGQGNVINIARGYIDSPTAFGELVQEAKTRTR